MEFQNHHLHFLLVPLMSQSHLIPFTDLARLFAERGLAITIVMTPLNADRYSEVVDSAKLLNLKIQFLSLPFPCQESGLPAGCENMDSLPSPDCATQFFQASNMLQEPVEKWFEGLELKPTCIIADICLPWTADVAVKFKIPRVIFHGISCFTLLCSHNLHYYKVHEHVISDTKPFLVPDMPDRIEFTKAQLPETMTQTSNGLRDVMEQFKVSELSAQGVLVNTFEELEQDYVKGIQKVRAKKVWCVGPLSLFNQTINKTSVDEHESLRWLDSKKQNSVLYVCFGSLSHLLPQQLMELGLGLEASNHPFIWVIKEGDYSKEMEKWLTEEKFEERNAGRGLILRGWAPQVLILSHPAIGGFLTHCGWNSTLEGVSSGIPMITWPMFAEQFYNEKLIVQVLKIGVRIGVDVSVHWGKEENHGVMVKRWDVKKAIDLLMGEGEESEDRRERAKQLGKMAKRAVEDGGSSYLNVTGMVQHFMLPQQTIITGTQSIKLNGNIVKEQEVA